MNKTHVIIGILFLTALLGLGLSYAPPTNKGENSTNIPENIWRGITVTGFWECLPHKNPDGPQTLECAVGLANDQNDAHYALDLNLIGQNKQYPIDFQTGTHLRVEGNFTPANTLNSDMWQKYPIDGIISVKKIEAI